MNVENRKTGIVEYEVSQLVCGNEPGWIAKVICQAYMFWPSCSKKNSDLSALDRELQHPKAREFGSANQAYLSRGDIACIC